MYRSQVVCLACLLAALALVAMVEGQANNASTPAPSTTTTTTTERPGVSFYLFVRKLFLNVKEARNVCQDRGKCRFIVSA